MRILQTLFASSEERLQSACFKLSEQRRRGRKPVTKENVRGLFELAQSLHSTYGVSNTLYGNGITGIPYSRRYLVPDIVRQVPGSTRILTELACDISNEKISEEALICLGNIGNNPSARDELHALIDICRNGPKTCEIPAMEAISYCYDEEALDFLIQKLQDRDPKVFVAAIHSLEQKLSLHADKIIPAFLSFLEQNLQQEERACRIIVYIITLKVSYLDTRRTREVKNTLTEIKEKDISRDFRDAISSCISTIDGELQRAYANQ